MRISYAYKNIINMVQELEAQEEAHRNAKCANNSQEEEWRHVPNKRRKV